MEKETKAAAFCKDSMNYKHHCHSSGGSSGAIYGLGVIGALFYFLQHAATFSAVCVGIGKAFFWPAILMFKLLTSLQM